MAQKASYSKLGAAIQQKDVVLGGKTLPEVSVLENNNGIVRDISKKL